MSYKETVEGVPEPFVCLAKSTNKHNRIYMTAEPLPEKLVEDIESVCILTLIIIEYEGLLRLVFEPACASQERKNWPQQSLILLNHCYVQLLLWLSSMQNCI